MFKRASRLIAVCIALCALSGAAAAGASAATLYVSNSAPVFTGGKSCVDPGYATIQSAITAGGSGAKIDICPGTYTEQLEIVHPVKLAAVSGAGTATVAMPDTPTYSGTSCDGTEKRDEISICTSGTVGITNLDVKALVPLETCGGGLNGISVGGSALLKATNVAIDGASTTLNSYKGCQHGIAILVGSDTPAEIGHASLKKVTVTGYEKNGPTVVGEGSTLAMTASSVTGEGPSPYIAQNGIEVAYGGHGTIKSTVVASNECDVSSCGAEGEQASGVLFYQAAAGSSLTSSTVEENDLGGYYASGSATTPSSPEVTFTKDVFTSNRYEGVELEEGVASLKSDTIDGTGRVGIDLYQYEGQASASKSSANATRIEGQAEAAIKVESDKKPGDIAGKFTFNGTTSGDGTVLKNESEDFEVVL